MAYSVSNSSNSDDHEMSYEVIHTFQPFSNEIATDTERRATSVRWLSLLFELFIFGELQCCSHCIRLQKIPLFALCCSPITTPQLVGWK